MKSFLLSLVLLLILLPTGQTIAAPDTYSVTTTTDGTLLKPSRSIFYSKNKPDWSEITNTPSVVTTDTLQTITANKTLSGTVRVTGSLFTANLTSSGTVTVTTLAATTLSGNGSALTSLNASSISSGTVPDARLSANVVTTTGGFTIGGNSTFSGVNTFTKISGPFHQNLLMEGESGLTVNCVNGWGEVYFQRSGVAEFHFRAGGYLVLIGGYQNASEQTCIAFNPSTPGGTYYGYIDSTGDLSITTAGKGLKIKEGSNARMGVATLSSGTVTVSNTSVTSSTRIFLTPQTDSANSGAVWISARTASTSFTIKSSNASDNRVVAWQLVEPAP